MNGPAKACIGSRTAQHGKAVAGAVSAVGDQRHQFLAGEVMLREERLDDRRRCRSPDGKTEIDRAVRANLSNALSQWRLIARLLLPLSLGNRGFVVFGIRLRRLVSNRSSVATSVKRSSWRGSSVSVGLDSTVPFNFFFRV